MMMSSRRLQRIEQQFLQIHPPPVKCPCCGDVDPETGCGPIRGGLILEMDDGLIWFFCKTCSRSFWARCHEDEHGQVSVSGPQQREGVPDPM